MRRLGGLITFVVLVGCTQLPPTDAPEDGGACSCAGRECGDDGCGGSCGTCPSGMTCNAGVCEGCEPACAGRECGDDGCGGLCGTCPTGMLCSSGACVEGGSVTHTFPPRDFACAPGSVAPCATTAPLRGDAARTVTVQRDFLPTTVSYVLTEIRWSPAVSTQPSGFNLDGLDSGDGSTDPLADCEEYNTDFGGLHDPAHVGVDNAFAALIGTVEGLMDPADCPGGTTEGCLDASILEDINAGRLLLVLEVTDLESYVHDDAVQAGLYVVQTIGDGAPALSGGRLAPGQTFATVRTAAPPTPADVFEGRLRARWTTAQLPLTGEQAALSPTNLTDVELRANLGPSGLARAHLGAVANGEDIIAASAAVMPGIEDVVRSVVESIADVSPSTADPTICDSVSQGVELFGVIASRTP